MVRVYTQKNKINLKLCRNTFKSNNELKRFLIIFLFFCLPLFSPIFFRNYILVLPQEAAGEVTRPDEAHESQAKEVTKTKKMTRTCEARAEEAAGGSLYRFHNERMSTRDRQWEPWSSLQENTTGQKNPCGLGARIGSTGVNSPMCKCLAK